MPSHTVGGDQTERRIGRAEVIAKVAGGVVHNFNNILAVLLGRVELMLSQVESGRLDPAQIRRGLLSVQKVTKDAAELLKRLRDLTRPPEDLPFATFDLNAAVVDAVDFIQPHVATVAQSLGVAMRLGHRLADGPLLVSGQSSALREVLVNLLLNAVEAMPAGGEVAVETRGEGGSAVLRIADTGVGMSEEVLARLFTPFFTTKGGGSSGLGLSSARDLIARHGGSIVVDSAVGRGTTFTITLPRADAAPDPDDPAAALALPSGLAVLVVEDEPAFGDVLREFLEAKGCRVTLAGTGAAALDELARQTYDVVLTDLLLPDVGGWEVARAAKRLSARSAVILVSGKMLPEDLWADGQTVDAALAKPIDFEKLSRIVAEVARRRGDATRSI